MSAHARSARESVRTIVTLTDQIGAALHLADCDDPLVTLRTAMASQRSKGLTLAEQDARWPHVAALLDEPTVTTFVDTRRADVRLAEAADRIATERGVDFGKGMLLAAEEDPALAAEYDSINFDED
jgi:hypothetical protein